MANLKLGNKLRRITLKGMEGEKYYNSWDPEQWNKVKAILSKFGITLSDYEVIFDDKEYQIEIKTGFFGATSGSILYKDSVIAKGSIEGSNYCDREARMEFFMDRLESGYKKENA